MVSGGIDIGRETVVVAAAEETARHPNAISRLDEGDDGSGDDPLKIRTDMGRFAVGTAAETATDGTEPPAALFGGDWPREVIGAAVEALLADARGDDGRFYGDDRLGYVDRGSEAGEQLSRLRDGVDPVAVDPGMAVCYDVFGSQPDGIGVALGDGVAHATLAVAGTPVATATVAYRDRWYDVTDADEATDSEPIGAAWDLTRYEAVLARLGADLAGEAPGLAGPIALALGGADAPAAVGPDAGSALGDPLGVDVEPVTVAEEPDASPARGALHVAERSDGRPGAVPAFAATGAYAAEQADTGAAAAAFADGVDPRAEDGRSGAGSGRVRGPDETGDGTLPAGAADDDREVAAALGRLVDGMERRADRLDASRDEVEESLGELQSDLAALQAEAATEQTVEELAESVEQLEANLEDLDADVGELQAALAGLEGDGDVDAPELSEALDGVAVDALENDIDDVEADLSARIEGLWGEIDDINDELVDLSATVGELPDIEGDLASTKSSVQELSAETAEIRESVDSLRETVESVRAAAATGEDVESVADDLASVSGDLDRLETEFRELDRADPEAVAELERDLDALRETVVDHAKRLDGVERTASDIDDRLEAAFRDTAKADALSSLQAEVSRIRTTAADAEERAGDATDRVEQQADTIEELADDVDQLRQMVDSVAGSSATRSELEDSLGELEERIAALEQSGGAGVLDSKGVMALSVGLGSAGLLGASIAFSLTEEVVGIGFLLLVVGPAAWLLLSVLE